MSALLQLAERCEKAVGADRELDGIIDRLLHDRPNDGDYHAGENCIWRVDDDSGLCVRGDGFARGSFCAASYTASLDAAMLLVPEGWSLIGIEQIRTDEAPEVRLMAMQSINENNEAYELHLKLEGLEAARAIFAKHAALNPIEEKSNEADS